MSVLKGKDALTHFERVRHALAKTEVTEPLPRSAEEVLDRMVRIDPRSGMGTNDPRGGDLASHLSYIEYREAWVEKRGGRDTSA